MKKLIFSVCIAIFAALFTVIHTAHTEKEAQSNIPLPNPFMFSEKLNEIKQDQVKNTRNSEKVEILELEKVEPRPYIEGVDGIVDSTILEYMWKQSLEHDIAYTLLLSIAAVESDFDTGARSHTNDSGIMQVNSNNFKWLSELAGIKKLDPMNYQHSIDMSVAYLIHLRDYWREQNASEEDVYELVITGYNAGLSGSQRYIKKYGWGRHPYFIKVNKQKRIYEEEMIKVNATD